MRILSVFFIICVALFCAQEVRADQIVVLQSQVQELTAMVKDLKIVVDRQQEQINALRLVKESATVVPPPASTPAPVFQVPVTSGKFAPEIGAMADIAYKQDSPKSDEEGADRVSVRELELILGSNVDPYSRLDATIGFSEEHVHLCETYLTRYELPLETTARIGRFKPRIGKNLALHRDTLDTVDEPLVIQRYFGEEGMSKSGVDVTKLLDLPSPLVHQLTVGVLEGGTGEGGTVFGDTMRRPTIYSHLKNYLDITDATNLDLGLNYAVGHKDDEAAFKVNILGLDATLIHHLNANQALKFQGEVFHMDRKDSFLDVEDPDTGAIIQNDIKGHLWGGYGLVDYRLNSEWATGFRFDYVELVDNPIDNPYSADVGYAGYLTFYQSEFARWRVQYNHINLATGKDDNQVFIQGTFVIGDHKHKLQ